MTELAWYRPLTEPLPEPAADDAATGYLHPGHAESLAEFGAPRELPHAGG